ncbi:MAG: single-stranded DNA-binding protein [Deferrisomatales bacterium]|nr:single-stranded DNA-binding protein [Deferrisomatales bacterium]
MAGINRCLFVGNLGKDPVLGATHGGTPVINMSVAINGTRKQKDGTYAKHVEWVPVVAYGAMASACANNLKKGSLVCVEGKFTTRSWLDIKEQRVIVTEIIAREITFLNTKGSSAPHYDMGVEPPAYGPTDDDAPY